MTDLEIMDYKRKRKTVLRDVENSGAEKIDIRIAYGDEIADVCMPGGKMDTYDSCPDGEVRTTGKIDGKYTLYTPGNPWPDAWDNRRDAYDGMKIMTE